MSLNTDQSGELHNEKPSFATFQQSFLQWRDNHINKTKRIRQKRGLMSSTDELPNLSKTISDENLLSKNYRHTDKNNQDGFSQQSNRINKTKQSQVSINIHHSLSESIELDNATTDNEVSIDGILCDNIF